MHDGRTRRRRQGTAGDGGGGDIPEEKDGGDSGQATDRLGVGGYQSIPGAEEQRAEPCTVYGVALA